MMGRALRGALNHNRRRDEFSEHENEQTGLGMLRESILEGVQMVRISGTCWRVYNVKREGV